MEEKTIVVDNSSSVEEETSQIEETLEPTLEETTQQDTNTISTNYTQQLETIIEQQQDINLKLENIDKLTQNFFGIVFLIFVFWLVYRFMLKPFFGSL